jgi:hypothetical protein
VLDACLAALVEKNFWHPLFRAEGPSGSLSSIFGDTEMAPLRFRLSPKSDARNQHGIRVFADSMIVASRFGKTRQFNRFA